MELENKICLGVAGNFAYHLEQAGELEDFKDVITDEINAPKGIFPFYLPKGDSFLSIYPIGTDELNLPKYEANAQVEPEIIIDFEIIYKEDKTVLDLIAKRFTTFNDCTIRKDGAKKISEKKNWGKNSKGISTQWIDIDKFEEGGIMDNYHLCSFVKRDRIIHPYGIDAPLIGYSYFYSKLKNWLIDKMNNQVDKGVLEDISMHLKDCKYPTHALISIGATAYAEFGEKNYLKSGDEIFIISYDKRYSDGDEMFKTNYDKRYSNDKIILLKQIVK